MSAAVMLDEVMRLGGDLPELVAAADRQLADRDVLRRLGGVRRAILTGCGDSLHAAWAAGPAFSELAACPAEIVGPQAFVADCRRGASEAVTDSTLLVGISASGGTPPWSRHCAAPAPSACERWR